MDARRPPILPVAIVFGAAALSPRVGFALGTNGAVLSPAATTTCATQGSLRTIANGP